MSRSFNWIYKLFSFFFSFSFSFSFFFTHTPLSICFYLSFFVFISLSTLCRRPKPPAVQVDRLEAESAWLLLLLPPELLSSHVAMLHSANALAHHHPASRLLLAHHHAVAWIDLVVAIIVDIGHCLWSPQSRVSSSVTQFCSTKKRER